MKLPEPKQIQSGLIIAGLITGGYLLYKAKKEATVLVTETINPASDKNIVYSNTPQIVKDGFTGLYSGLDSIGLLPGTQNTINPVEVVTKKLNPASDKNIVYSNTPQPIKNGFNSFYGALDSVGLLPRF